MRGLRATINGNPVLISTLKRVVAMETGLRLLNSAITLIAGRRFAETPNATQSPGQQMATAVDRQGLPRT
jgi:hypothetical protein